MNTPGGNSTQAEAAAALIGDDHDDDDTVTNIDGRSLRRRRNRDAVIASLISLIHEGDLDPTIDKIADRAEVSPRSIFRYFTDLNDLARTAIETEIRRALPLATIQNVGQGPLDDRVESMIESRLRTIVPTWQLFRVAKTKAPNIPEIDRGLALVAEMMADQIRRHFANELDQMDEVVADHLATVVSTAVGHDGYDTQRRLLERTDDEIAASWRELLLRALR